MCLILIESTKATNYLRSNAGMIKDEIDLKAIVLEDFEAWERELFDSHSYSSIVVARKLKALIRNIIIKAYVVKKKIASIAKNLVAAIARKQ